MDAFVERDLIELMKSIALSLREIRSELADLNVAVRELGVCEEVECDGGDCECSCNSEDEEESSEEI
jgi:hypothetical protein